MKALQPQCPKQNVVGVRVLNNLQYVPFMYDQCVGFQGCSLHDDQRYREGLDLHACMQHTGAWCVGSPAPAREPACDQCEGFQVCFLYDGQCHRESPQGGASTVQRYGSRGLITKGFVMKDLLPQLVNQTLISTMAFMDAPSTTTANTMNV